MRIVHLSDSDLQGGAARGAYWLHKALQGQELESMMLVGRKFSDDPSVYSRDGQCSRIARRIRAELDSLPLRLYRNKNASFWSVGWVPNSTDRYVRMLRPDIVHLHWAGGSFVPISCLARMGVPIVWTLRDMWAFTGGCHYTLNCEGYRTACGHCPQLSATSERDLSRWIWKRKRERWEDVDIWLVPLSAWLAECIRESSLFRNRPVDVIPNGLDTSRFVPVDKRVARARWGLPRDKQIVLFGAIKGTREQRKGFRYLRDALRKLAANGLSDRIELVVFGQSESDLMDDIGVATRSVGHQDDDARLALLYAAADLMVAPSTQEAFGKTLIESMACGTPVVAFDCCGPRDIVEHLRTGYLAPPYDAGGLADGIRWCLSDRTRLDELGRRARDRVEDKFDIGKVARSYVALYDRVLNGPAG